MSISCSNSLIQPRKGFRYSTLWLSTADAITSVEVRLPPLLVICIIIDIDFIQIQLEIIHSREAGLEGSGC